MILTVLLLLNFAVAASAQGTADVESIVNEIRTEQGVSDSSQINPDRVSQAELIKLGDALSESMMGTDAHTRMENMMGGEGSDSLNAMYSRMGYNYLANYPYSGPYNPMHYGMMGNFGWAGMVVLGLILVAFVAVLFVVIRRSPHRLRASETPLEILNRRYASGEITKDEYERMKGELGN